MESVDALFLTHAHSDHLGRLPLLVERGFHGPIYMTEATAALAVPMLRVLLRTDRTTTRHWTWSKEFRLRAEAGRKSLWLHWRQCKHRKEIAPENIEQATASMQELIDRFGGQTPPVKVTVCDECVAEEVAAVLREARPVKYGAAIEAAPGVRVTFLDAGHIPGSASILFEVSFGEKKRRVLFSGDLGNGLSPLVAPPRPAPAVDAVYVECTYGTIRRKASVRGQPALFRRAVGEAVARGGVAWIPCFSMDRTQKILYELHLAQREKLLPERLPIYCPSPTAKEVTALYREHRQDGWFPPAIAADAEAFSPRDVRGTVPSIRRLPRPCIIISTSDLMSAAWMRRLLERPAARAVHERLPGGVSGPRHRRRTAPPRRGQARHRRAVDPGAGEGAGVLVFLRPRRRRRHRRLAGQRAQGGDHRSRPRRPARIDRPRRGASRAGTPAGGHRQAEASRWNCSEAPGVPCRRFAVHALRRQHGKRRMCLSSPLWQTAEKCG